MLGLYNYIANSKAVQSIVRGGLQLFYKADRTQAPLGEEQVRNNSFDEISGDLVSNPTFDLGSEEVQNGAFNLGSEKVINGDFSNGTNDWDTSNSTISIENGALKITSTGGNRPQANQIVNNLVPGSQYKLSAVAKRGTTANDVEIEISGIASTSTSNRNTTTEYETIFYIFTATATSHTIQAKIDDGSESSGTTAYFSNVSVKEIPNWTTVGNVNISDSKANFTSGADSYVLQNILTVGKSYQISADYNVTSISGGYFGTNGTNAANVSLVGLSGVGTITATIIAENTNLIFRSSNFNGSVTNISVKEVPNWVPGSAWSFNDGLAIGTYAAGTPGQLSQAGFLTAGKSYSVSVTIDSIASGKSLKVALGSGGSELVFSNVGTTTLIGTAAANEIIYLFGNESGFSASISNISVKQLDPNNRWTVGPSAAIATLGEGFVDIFKETGAGSTDAYIYQDILENNKTYQVTFSGVINEGVLFFGTNAVDTNEFTAGTYENETFNFTTTSTDNFIIRNPNTGSKIDARITNVSVKEITNSIKDHSKNSNDGILYSGKALEFDGTGDIVELNDANLTGEFTVCTWIKPDTFTSCVVFGDTGNEDWIRLESATSITVKIANSSTGYAPITHGGNIAQDKWSRLIVTRGSDNIVRFGINGVLYSPSTAARAGTFDFNLLGSKDSTEMNGALADVQVYDKAWNATDVKYDWENPDKDVFDRVGEVQVLGEEEVVNTDFATPQSDWTFANGWGLNSNTAVYDGTGAQYAKFVQPLTTVAGRTYQVEFTLDEISGSSLKFGLATSANAFLSDAAQFTTPGTHTITMRATASDNRIVLQVNSATMTCTVSNVSVREVTTHASHILPTDCKSLLRLNEGAGDRVYDAAPVLGEDQMESRNGSFELGSEEVVDGDFPLPNVNWTVGDKWSIANNSARLLSTNSTASSLSQSSVFEVGKTYNLIFDATVISGTAKVEKDGGAVLIEINATKTYNFTFVADRTDLYFNRKGSVSDVTISNVSVKELPNWSYVDGIELDDSGVFFNNGNDNIFQNFSYIDGATYAIGFEGASDTGLIRYRTGFDGISNEYREAPIPGTIIWKTDSSSQRIQIFGPSSGTATVSKVTIKEVKQAESFAIVGDKNFLHQQPHIPQYAMSSFSKKMVFDGSNDYVACGSDASIDDVFSGGGTISAWISVSSDGGENIGTIMGKGTVSVRVKEDDNGGVMLNLAKGFSNTNADFLTSDEVILENKMNHIAITYDDSSSSNTPSFYVNGVSTAIDTGNSTIPVGSASADASSNLIIGNALAGGTRSFDGIIDEVSLFKTELTQSEILELYNSGCAYNSNNYLKQYVNFHSSGLLSLSSVNAQHPVVIHSSNSISFDDTMFEVETAYFDYEANDVIIYTTSEATYDASYGRPLLPVGSKVNISGRITANDGSGSLYNDVDNDGYIDIALGTSANIIDIGIHTSSSKTIKVDSQGYFSFIHTIVGSPSSKMNITAHDIRPSGVDTGVLISELSIMSNPLVGYWRNNGAEQWDDLSVNSSHGTVSGSPTEIFLQEVPFFGKDSLGMFMNKPRLGGLNFNGSGYVANQGMPTISDNISFSFWIKLEDFVTGNIAQVVGKRTNSDSKWCRVYRPSADSLRLEVAASDQLDFTIQEAEWVHVATTIDGRAAKAYVNGALTAQATLSGDFNFLSANDFSVGSWKDTATSVSNNSLLNGVVDDVMVYDETLTLKQVTKNYNATKSKHKN